MAGQQAAPESAPARYLDRQPSAILPAWYYSLNPLESVFMRRHPGRKLFAALLLLVLCAVVLLDLAPPLAVPAARREAATAVVPQNPAAVAAELLPAPKPAASLPAPAVVVLTPLPPDFLQPAGTHVEIYTAQKGNTLATLVRHYLPQSHYMTAGELETAMTQANRLKGPFLKPGPVLIPGIEDQPIVEKIIPVKKDFEVRAIYLTGLMAGSEHGMRILREWRAAGGNAVVFDVKDSNGVVNIPFQHRLAPGDRPVIPNLAKYMRFVHALGMHGIARIAIFRDEELVKHHPELAVQSRRSKQAWRENGKLVWTDPSHREVQEYNIALAREAAAAGADEIQFDYVRFPAEGDQKDARFAFESEHPKWIRADVIADFLHKAYAEVHGQGALLSLDVFGVMAWQRNVDLAHTGQDIVRMAQECDVLSPMIYPSHFFGMDGYKTPGDAPEHFISESMERFGKITAGSGVVLRPWLQAFGWRTKTYSPDYVVTQVSVARAHSGVGFLFWNARNDYSKPFTAMGEMRAAKGRYFRGDELPRRTAAEASPPGDPAPAAPAQPTGLP